MEDERLGLSELLVKIAELEKQVENDKVEIKTGNIWKRVVDSLLVDYIDEPADLSDKMTLADMLFDEAEETYNTWYNGD